ALVCSGEIAFRHKSSARPWKKFSYQFDGIVTILLFSLLRLFQRRQYGNEVFGEAPAIIFQQLADAFVTGGSNDQPYVMFLFCSIYDLRIVVRGSVRILLPGE